jgi:hypothetical protein
MAPQIENPEFNIDALLGIKNRIESKSETIDDYKKLDYFLSSVGLSNFILNNIKEKGFTSYQNYIDTRKSNNPSKDLISESYVYGVIIECLNILMRQISK